MSGLMFDPGDANTRNRVLGETSRLDRMMGSTEDVITGGTGDDDMRRFYKQELSQHLLVQGGASGAVCGFVTMNTAPTTYKGGVALVTNRTGTGLWNKTMTGGNKVVPFLRYDNTGFPCGSDQYGFHLPGINCFVYTDPATAPGSGFDLPPSWPVDP